MCTAHRTRMIPMLALLAMLLGASGCQQYAAPRFELLKTQITEESDEGYVLSFTLKGTNVNEVELPLERVRYSLNLDGKRVFNGMASAEATLPREGTQQVRLLTSVPLSDGAVVPAGSQRYVLSGEIEYRLPGSIAEVLFDTDIRKPKAQFNMRGELDFGGQPSGPSGP